MSHNGLTVMSASDFHFRQKIALTILILTIVCFSVYSFAIFNGTSRDDMAIFEILKTHSPQEGLWPLFKRLMVTIESSFQTGLFRPISHLTFIADHLMWGENPGGFHLTNILLHVTATLLILWLCIEGGLPLWGGALAGLLFSVHPIHFETVGLIHNRSDILCLIFLLAATGTFHYYRKTHSAGLLIASLASFSFALLSKETAVVFPAVIIGYDYLCLGKDRPPKEKWHRFLIYGFFAFILLGYFVLRREVLGSMIQFERVWGAYQFPAGDGWGWRPATVLALGGFYLWLLLTSFNPFDFCADYFLVPVNSVLDPAALCPLSVIAAAIYIFWRFRPLSAIGTFGVVWFLLTYLPTSNLVPIGNMFSQHFMYIPSAGLFIAGADVFTKIWQRISLDSKLRYLKISLAVFVVLVAVFWGRSTIFRNIYYCDDKRLWFYSAKHPLASPRAHLVVGQYYLKAGDYPSAQKELLLSLVKNPEYHPANMMLGFAYKQQGQNALAGQYFSRAAVFAQSRGDFESLQEAVYELKSLGISYPAPSRP